MVKPCPIRTALMAGPTVAGGVSQGHLLENKQTMAIQTALTRACFETQCLETTATVLSREVVQPAIQGPRVEGLQQVAYTIGVSGCGQRPPSVVGLSGRRGRVFCRRRWQTPRAVTAWGWCSSGLKHKYA
jgi:hypothetical protein